MSILLLTGNRRARKPGAQARNASSPAHSHPLQMAMTGGGAGGSDTMSTASTVAVVEAARARMAAVMEPAARRVMTTFQQHQPSTQASMGGRDVEGIEMDSLESCGRLSIVSKDSISSHKLNNLSSSPSFLPASIFTIPSTNAAGPPNSTNQPVVLTQNNSAQYATVVTEANSARKRLNLNGICRPNDSTMATIRNRQRQRNLTSGGGSNNYMRHNSMVIDEADSDENDEDREQMAVSCYVEDIILPEHSIKSLYDLQVLSLRTNDMHTFPMSVLRLASLQSLDLSDNMLVIVPPEINQLVNLQELVLDQNVLSVLPGSLWDLVQLHVLRVAHNRLSLPPDKFADMRAIVLTDTEIKPDNTTKSINLTNLNLRGNHLKGNIILGSYGNLTELDVSDNNIDSLDLSAVEQLQILQCSRNSLSQLTIFGKNLTSIIAGNNRISDMSVIIPPVGLKHLDVSYNRLDTLPEWLGSCQELRSLFASNNTIRCLPDHMFCNDMPYLHTLQLAYNQLQQLPSIQRRLPIQECFLQNNNLANLPENFFRSVYNVKVLNVSNNRLCDLPDCDADLYIEKLLMTANCLTDKSLAKLAPHLRNLRIIHAAYNNFTAIPESSTLYWGDIEEIVFSGNKLLRLPTNIGTMANLSVLRVHSNLLQSVPKLAHLLALRVLDLAHNQLDRIDLTDLIPPNLKFLDLSCNTKLHVDSQQFNTYRTQRPMSLVDVSGKNRTTLPLTPSLFSEVDLTESSWTVGFSETSGSKQRLYISQIRLSAFCNSEGLFGMFDGENNSDMPSSVDKIVPRILLEERTCKETAMEYMKYTMLSAHRELKDKGQKHGVNAVIVHIMKSKICTDYSFSGNVKKYVMKIASVGDAKVVLGTASGPIRLLPIKQKRQIKTNPQIHLMVPDPDITEVYLDEHDDYMIIANKNLWDVMSPEHAVKEVSQQRNVILAAKRLQDLAQSYGAEENLSVIVVKFNLIGTDVDILMRELRQTIRKNNYHHPLDAAFASSGPCQPGCCCEALNNECMQCIDKIASPPPPPPPPLPPFLHHDDRSSASGQSEPGGFGEIHHATPAKAYIAQLNRHHHENPIGRNLRSVTPLHFEAAEVKVSPERRSYRGVAKALRAARRDEDNKSVREDTDSALSEEQFKCWEYMLEQNTQMLFDKELNTLNKGGYPGRNKAIIVGNGGGPVPFATVKHLPISRSSPHLNSEVHNNHSSSNANHQPNGAGGFLSRQFGSARSFNPLVGRPLSRLSLDKKLVGGPHAAYFGSLQRLMPYNLEYDFAVMQERGLCDSLDLDRMQQYWGVTTTEL